MRKTSTRKAQGARRLYAASRDISLSAISDRLSALPCNRRYADKTSLYKTMAAYSEYFKGLKK